MTTVLRPRSNFIALSILIASGTLALIASRTVGDIRLTIGIVAVGLVLMQAPRVAEQWERAVVLRLGRFVGLRGPGLFWVIPFVDRVTSWIDQRTITTSFAAEQTLTSDAVPVNVDAVLFWMVHDAEKAALEVQDYPQAVSWASQTALRDIVIPVALQDAMSREAQASREKQARIILGQAEEEIAQSFERAARSYTDNPTAFQLRAMNMLYEGLKDKGALMLVPSTAVEALGMGGMLGAAAMGQTRMAERIGKAPNED